MKKKGMDKGKQHVFIRYDDVGLIKIMAARLTKEPEGVGTILTGTPGIAKSWLLWKTVIFLARPELWTTATGEDPLPYKPGVVFVAKGQKGEPRTSAFFLEDGVVHDLRVEGTRVVPSFEPCADAMLLCEPWHSSGEMPGWLHRKVGLFPFDEEKYFHQTQKGSTELSYMPCPVGNELLVMGWWLRTAHGGVVADNPFPTKDEILEGVRERGPFTRVVINTHKKRKDFDAGREMAFRQAKGEDVLRVISGATAENVAIKVSFNFARLVTNREPDDPYATRMMVPSTLQVCSGCARTCAQKRSASCAKN